MMVLLLKHDSDRYAIDVSRVVEVIPNVPLQAFPRAPVYVRGLLNYRGYVVPVIDLAVLIDDKVTVSSLSSRLIVVAFENKQYVALLAENVTETLKVTEDLFSTTSVNRGNVSFVDGVAIDAYGMLQRINIDAILPDDIKSVIESCSGQSPAPGQGAGDV